MTARVVNVSSYAALASEGISLHCDCKLLLARKTGTVIGVMRLERMMIYRMFDSVFGHLKVHFCVSNMDRIVFGCSVRYRMPGAWPLRTCSQIRAAFRRLRFMT